MKKEKNEFYVDTNIKRIIIKNNLIEFIKKAKIDILLYQSYDYIQINELNKIKLYIFNVISEVLLNWIKKG